MYIIPHFLQFEAKKLIKFKLNNILSDLTDNLVDNLFNYHEYDKYQKIMLSLDKDIKETILNILKECISILDNLYVNSLERKRQFNISNRNVPRSIVTVFGILEFERTYYYDKHDKNKYFYFIDTLFNFNAYERYDKLVKGLAIDNAIKTNQKKGAELINNQLNSISSYLENNQPFNISRQDIYNWIKKWNIPSIEYDPIDIKGETLYVMIDEKYIHEQIKAITENKACENKSNNEIKNDILNIINSLKNPSKQLLLPAPKEKTKHFIMSKAFVTFTKIKKENKRRTLENRKVFLTSSPNPWDLFMDFIAKIYDFEKIKTIKVLSDAGTWITSGISNLKLFVDNIVVPCLCEFHVRQKVNRITKDDNIRKKLNKAIDQDDKDEFNRIFKNILVGKDEKRIKVLKGYKHYILVHWDAIKNMEASKYKSSMESHISHCIAKYFSYEPKAYSKFRIEKLLKLREAYLNDINILDLYLKTCDNKELVTIKKEELDYSIFENTSQSNIPLLYSASSTYTAKALKGLSS